MMWDNGRKSTNLYRNAAMNHVILGQNSRFCAIVRDGVGANIHIIQPNLSLLNPGFKRATKE